MPGPVYIRRSGDDYADNPVLVSDTDPMPVTIIGGAGAITEYTEGDTDATIIGSAILWEDAADTLRAVSSAKPLPVSVTGTFAVSGDVAHDAADSGNPVKIGAKGVTALPAAVTNGDRVDLVADTTGRLLVSPTVLDASTDDVAIGVSAGATGASYYVKADLSSTVVAIKAGTGNLFSFFFDNSEGGAAAYVSIHDVAAGSVSVGSATGLVLRRKVPAGGTAELVYPAHGVEFATAISIVAHSTRTGSSAPGTALHVEASYV